MEPKAALDDLVVAAEHVLAKARDLSQRSDLEEDAALEDPRRAARLLADLSGTLEEAVAVVRELASRVDQAEAARHERIRFTEEGVAATVKEIERLAARRPQLASARLLAELAAALRLLELGPAVSLLVASPAAAAVPHELSEAIAAWKLGDLDRGRQAVEELRRLAADQRAAPGVLRELAVVAAWLEHQVGEEALAEATLNELVAQSPHDATVHVERAAHSLVHANGVAAADEARQALELDPDDGVAYLPLGASSEAVGDYGEAVELYREGCGRLKTMTLARLGQGATFLQPSGMLHLTRAEQLGKLGAVDEALEAVDAALVARVAGEQLYPEAEAYELRCRLLERKQAPVSDVAAAALAAGQRHLWNGANDRAIPQLRIAVRGGPATPDAGWSLAGALLASAYAGGALPDRAVAEEARAVWDDWCARIGAPSREAPWGYVDRALIAEAVGLAEGQDRELMAWEAVLFCERALVLDLLSALAWGRSSRYLRSLNLEPLALESANAGFAANPDDQTVLEERVALLANVGRYDEAIATIERIPGADADPWLSGVRAFGLLRQGRAADAVSYLELPLSGSWDLGWYLDLRAACFIDLGRFDDAVFDLRRLLEVDVGMGGDSAIRRSLAHAVLGEVGEAAARFEEARIDPTVDPSYKASVEACIALARDDEAEARRLVEEAFAASRNIHLARDAVRTVRSALAVLGHRGHPPAGGAQVLQAAEEALSRWQPGPDVDSADLELARLRARHRSDEASDAWVALAAIRARRLRQAGELTAAAGAYQELRDGRFEPEATLAYGDVLEQRSAVAVAEGDVDEARLLFESLRDLGRAPAPFAEVVVADALRAGGRSAEAVAVLSELALRAVEPADRLIVQERLGECRLRVGDHDLAETAFSAALAAATQLGDHRRAAQLEVRLAVTAALTGGTSEIFEQHLSEALSHWTEAGTLDPRSVLEHELHWLVEAVRAEGGGSAIKILDGANVAGGPEENSRRSPHG